MGFWLWRGVCWAVVVSVGFVAADSGTCPPTQHPVCVPDVPCSETCSQGYAQCDPRDVWKRDGKTYGTCVCGNGRGGDWCCEDGHTGNRCQLCSSTSACPAKDSGNRTLACDNTMVAYINTPTQFQCLGRTPPVVEWVRAKDFMNCPHCNVALMVEVTCTDLMRNGNGTCHVGLFVADFDHLPNRPLKQSGPHGLCTLKNCSRVEVIRPTSKTPGYVAYRCEDTDCTCPPGAGPVCPEVLWRDNITGSGFVNCSFHGACIVTHPRVLNGTSVTVACEAGACVPAEGIIQPVPLPFWTAWMTGLVISGSVVMVVLIIASIWQCRRYRRERKQRMSDWKWKHRAEVGATVFLWAPDTPLQAVHRRPHHTILVECRQIGYTLDTPTGPIVPLAPTELQIQSGHTLTIMGPVGAGKTTLLDILGGLPKEGDVTGSMSLNRELLTRDNMNVYRQMIGYVMQDETLMPELTVHESVMYSAQLRLPIGMSDPEKDNRVTSVLDRLGLRHVQHTRVGNTELRGVSGGEKRRVAIAMELVADPQILLLDEPTCGLDSHNALVVVETLKRLAVGAVTEDGQDVLEAEFTTRLEPPIIVYSIQQPSADMFKLFDQLVVLTGGRVMYNGPANQVVEHLQNLGHVPMSRCNPAEFVLRLAATAPTHELDALVGTASRRRWAAAAVRPEDTSPQSTPPKSTLEMQSIATPVVHVAAADGPDDDEDGWFGALPRDEPSDGEESTEEDAPLLGGLNVLMEVKEATRFYPNFLERIPVLFLRTRRQFTRNLYVLIAHVMVAMVAGFILGCMSPVLRVRRKCPHYDEWGVTDFDGVRNDLGIMFLLLGVLSFGSLSALDVFLRDRDLYLAERLKGYYTPTAYFIPKVLWDLIPLRVFPAPILGAIVYYRPWSWFGFGLRPDAENFAWFLGVLVIFNVVAALMCMCVVLALPRPGVATLVAALLMLYQMGFGGVLVRYDSLPQALHWCRYTSFFGCAHELLMVNELRGEMVMFNPRNNRGEVLACIPQEGEVFLLNVGMDATKWTRDLVLLVGWGVIYFAVAWILVSPGRRVWFTRWTLKRRRRQQQD